MSHHFSFRASEQPSRRWRLRILLGVLAATILGLLFRAYLTPEFIVDLANRLILCF